MVSSYVIVGHSERRKYHPEDDVNIVDQVRAQLAFVLEGIVTQILLPKIVGKGRAMAAEILVVTAAIRALIRDDKPVLIENKPTDGSTATPTPTASASAGSSGSPSPSASALDNNVYRGSNAEDSSCSN